MNLHTGKILGSIKGFDGYEEFTWQVFVLFSPLLTVLVVYFILACWAAGTAISSGLVVPML